MITQEKSLEVGGISFAKDGPTIVSLEQLFTWVIWQYPRRKSKGYFGAVRPAFPEVGWFPALIQADQRRVLVFGGVEETFATPEAAAKHLETVNI